MDRSLERPVKRLARAWDDLYKVSNVVDPTTRDEPWTDGMFNGDRLSPDFHQHAGLLAYSTRVVGHGSTAFTNTVLAAIRSREVISALYAATGKIYTKDTRVSSLPLEQAVKDPRAFGRTIRALCDAPIAVFDGTIEMPQLMFLLGVRSVVRRGVTVVVRIGRLDPAAWQEMAFNLRELSLVTAPNRSDLTFEAGLRSALVEGLKLYARRPFHSSDLPAFAPVRQLGGDPDDYQPRPPEEHVIVLCPFDDNYTQDCWPELQRALRERWTPGKDPGPARRVIDLRSPELVGRRLFEAIRRDDECVVDLTRNRPNVFFELGARMVTNEKGARIVRCIDLQDDTGHVPSSTSAGSPDQLDTLLGVREYCITTGSDPNITKALGLDAAWPGGSVTPGYAFEIAQRSVDLRQETGGRTLDFLLWKVMEETIGRDHSGTMTFPGLYPVKNMAIRAQTRQFAFDTMLAFVVFNDTLPPERRDAGHRSSALFDLERMLADLEIDEPERERLAMLIKQLKGVVP
jgi:hypothetical protein